MTVPELHHDVIWITLDRDRDEFLEVAQSVCVETQLQRLVSVNGQSTGAWLYVDEPAESCVWQTDKELGRNEAAVSQHHVVVVRSLAEDCAGVQSVE